MNNVEISKILEETARALDFVGADPIIVAEFEKASRRVEAAEIPFEVFANASRSRRAAEELDRALAFCLPDVLANVVAETRELIATGTFPLRKTLEKDVSPRAFELLRLESLDPDGVFFLREKMGIRDVAALKFAARRGSLSETGIFSPEQETEILDEIQKLAETRISRANVDSNGSDAEILAFCAAEQNLSDDDPALMFLANADALGDFVLQSLEKELENDAPRKKSEKREKKRADGKIKSSTSEKRAVVRQNRRAAARRRESDFARRRGASAGRRSTGFSRRTREKSKKRRGLFGLIGRLFSIFSVFSRAWRRILRFFAPPSPQPIATFPSSNRYRRPDAPIRSTTASRAAESNANLPPWTRIERVGALARRDACVSQLDFLLETEAPEDAFEIVKNAPFVRSVLEETPRFLAVELDAAAFDLPFNSRPTPNAPLRFFAAPSLTFGVRALAATATPEHWRNLRERSAKRGWNLTAFGLYDGPTRIASRTPERVYERLETPFVNAELRSERAESWIDAGAPELLTLDDLRGDMHTHSIFSDGTGALDEMIAEARRLGLDYLAATDHTKRVRPIVNGMDDAEVLRYWSFIDELNQKLRDSGVDFRVLKGAEVDILSDGRLDLKDETLEKADWVVASLHFGSDDSPRRLRRRYLAALSHPAVDVVAHPTGRTIGIKAPMEIDVNFLCETAAKYGKFLELNAQPRRLDLDVEGLGVAKKAGVPIVISTDAHSPNHLEYLRFGVEQARRAGLTRADVANARSWPELLRWRDERRANVAETVK